MRIYLTYLLAFLCLASHLEAQVPTHQPRAYHFLQGNEVKALFNPGILFWDGVSRSQFQVPYQAGQATPSPLFSGALWLGAYDAGGNLLMAANTYRNQGNDFWAGPIDANSLMPASSYAHNFDHIWTVKRFEIDAHIQDFTADGIINGPVPRNILIWPAKGNLHFAQEMGFALPNQDLAPFYDRNSNGLYEPLLGDYPVYDHNRADAIAEDMLWYVYNDAADLHTQTNGQPLKAEVQVTAWSFHCNNNTLLNRTIFVRHKVWNRSGLDWYNYKMGLWHDADLGCANDDYFGVDTTLKTLYWYNKDNNDDNPCGSSGILGYGLNPPAQAMTFLNKPLNSVIYHINSNFNPMGDPTSSIGYYNLLSGKWSNGQPIYATGNGYGSNGAAPTTRYTFPGTITNPNEWSMYSNNLSGLDNREVAATHQALVRAGEAFTLDVSYSYHRDAQQNNIGNALLALQEVPNIQQWYDSNFVFPNCQQRSTCVQNCVYPGDMNNNGINSDFDLLDWGVAVGQNAIVASRTAPADDWFPHQPPTPATNAYLDANGDGNIDDLDWDVNTQNIDLTHSLYTSAQEGFNTVGSELTLQRPGPVLPGLPYDTIPNRNTNVRIRIRLGSPAQPVANAYGLTFRLDYDTDVLQLLPLSNIRFNYQGNAMGGKRRTRFEHGTIHYADVRTNGMDTTADGNLLELTFRVRANAPIQQPIMTTDLCFRDFKLVDAQGNTVPIGAQCLTLPYEAGNQVVSIRPLEETDYQATLFPNPTEGESQLALVLDHAQTLHIQLLDVTGRLVYQHPVQDLPQGRHTLTLPTQQLPTGVYYCRIASEQQQQTLPLIKNH